MAKGYRPVRRDQPFLVPPDMREWLPEDHAVWLVIGAVDHLDTSAVHAARRTGGAGTAGYDPDMLVTLLVWAYANKVTSSRRIEGLCHTDVAFRVICAGGVPDHVTIARFRAAFPGVARELFTQVLMLCARLGMGQVGTVALDGTKVAADASKAANRTEETLRKLAGERMAEHAAADAAEDERFGEGNRGDRVPPGGGGGGGSRDERIARALADLEAERQAAQAQADAQAREYLQALESGQAPPGNVPAAAAVTAARLRLDRAEAAQRELIGAREARDAQARAAGHRGDRGKRPASPDGHAGVRKARASLARAEARAADAARKAAVKGPGPVRNITDPDSRLMPVRGGGFIQGYNAQNVTSADKLIIATELTDDTTDTGWFEPMLAAALDAATLITACQPPPASTTPVPGGSAPACDCPVKLFLADAGYLSEDNLTIAGPDRLIATGKHRDLEKQARAGGNPETSARSGAITAMAARLATEEGITAYRQRGHIAETPHGHIKHNMGFRQLSMRGMPKAAAEWTFAATVHNLFKAITTGHLTTAALDSLAPQPA